MKNLIMIFFSVLLGISGQLCLKQGMLQVGRFNSDPSQAIPLLIKAFQTPLVFLGFLSYAISSLAWLIVLSRVELSFAYPLVSIGYVIVVLLSSILFNEHVTFTRLAGTFVIAIGVYLISIS
ncbi:MAG: EamA family transporter [Candidatus Firestonebacteria bacterium]